MPSPFGCWRWFDSLSRLLLVASLPSPSSTLGVNDDEVVVIGLAGDMPLGGEGCHAVDPPAAFGEVRGKNMLPVGDGSRVVGALLHEPVW